MRLHLVRRMYEYSDAREFDEVMTWPVPDGASIIAANVSMGADLGTDRPRLCEVIYFYTVPD